MVRKTLFVVDVRETEQVIRITCEEGAEAIAEDLRGWGYLPPSRAVSQNRRYWTLDVPMGDPAAMERGQQHALHLQSLGYEVIPY